MSFSAVVVDITNNTIAVVVLVHIVSVVICFFFLTVIRQVDFNSPLRLSKVVFFSVVVFVVLEVVVIFFRHHDCCCCHSVLAWPRGRASRGQSINADEFGIFMNS